MNCQEVAQKIISTINENPDDEFIDDFQDDVENHGVYLEFSDFLLDELRPNNDISMTNEFNVLAYLTQEGQKLIAADSFSYELDFSNRYMFKDLFIKQIKPYIQTTLQEIQNDNTMTKIYFMQSLAQTFQKLLIHCYNIRQISDRFLKYLFQSISEKRPFKITKNKAITSFSFLGENYEIEYTQYNFVFTFNSLNELDDENFETFTQKIDWDCDVIKLSLQHGEYEMKMQQERDDQNAKWYEENYENEMRCDCGQNDENEMQYEENDDDEMQYEENDDDEMQYEENDDDEMQCEENDNIEV